jgi:hypothetical protein
LTEYHGRSPCAVPSVRDCQELCAPWTVDMATMRLLREGDRLALELSHHGVASSRVIILGPAQNAHPYVTADGKYILVQAQEKESMRTVVYFALTGGEVGQIPGQFSLSDAKVIGSTLYYVCAKPGISDLSLRAVRLPDGKPLWHRNILVPLPDVGSKLPS